MDIEKIETEKAAVAVVRGGDLYFEDVQSALDLTANLHYHFDCDRVVMDKSLISESFFDLKTRLAGDILQKLVMYGVKIAIVGDFSVYSSNSLQDFIYECNKGSHILFVPTEEQAIEKLSRLK